MDVYIGQQPGNTNPPHTISNGLTAQFPPTSTQATPFPTAPPNSKPVKLSELPLSVLVLENAEVKKLWDDYHGALAQVITSSKEVLESTRCIQSVFMKWQDIQSQSGAQAIYAK
jgi:hypothetical protein